MAMMNKTIAMAMAIANKTMAIAMKFSGLV